MRVDVIDPKDVKRLCWYWDIEYQEVDGVIHMTRENWAQFATVPDLNRNQRRALKAYVRKLEKKA